MQAKKFRTLWQCLWWMQSLAWGASVVAGIATVAFRLQHGPDPYLDPAAFLIVPGAFGFYSLVSATFAAFTVSDDRAALQSFVGLAIASLFSGAAAFWCMSFFGVQI